MLCCTDVFMMKHLVTLIFLPSLVLAETHVISGKVLTDKGCSNKAMVWLSLDKENYKERLLLMHTEVPIGGTFSFYVKPGEYQIRGSDESGCHYLQKLSLKDSRENVTVRLVSP